MKSISTIKYYGFCFLSLIGLVLLIVHLQSNYSTEISSSHQSILYSPWRVTNSVMFVVLFVEFIIDFVIGYIFPEFKSSEIQDDMIGSMMTIMSCLFSSSFLLDILPNSLVNNLYLLDQLCLLGHMIAINGAFSKLYQFGENFWNIYIIPWLMCFANLGCLLSILSISFRAYQSTLSLSEVFNIIVCFQKFSTAVVLSVLLSKIFAANLANNQDEAYYSLLSQKYICGIVIICLSMFLFSSSIVCYWKRYENISSILQIHIVEHSIFTLMISIFLSRLLRGKLRALDERIKMVVKMCYILKYLFIDNYFNI